MPVFNPIGSLMSRGGSAPEAPTQEQYYSGPAAWSGYTPYAANVPNYYGPGGTYSQGGGQWVPTSGMAGGQPLPQNRPSGARELSDEERRRNAYSNYIRGGMDPARAARVTGFDQAAWESDQSRFTISPETSATLTREAALGRIRGAPTRQERGGSSTFAERTGSGVVGGEKAQTPWDEAINRLREISQTGWTETARQELDRRLAQAQRSSAAQRMAQVQGAQARGMGPQAGLLGQMQGAQDETLAASDAATQIATAGEQNRLSASQALGTMGMAVEGQQFGQNMARAQAIDDFNRWGSGMQFNVAQQGYENQMQQYMLAEQQRMQRQQQMMQLIGMMGSMYGGGMGGM